MTFPLSKIDVKMVVMLRATLAGTAEGDIKKQHQDKTTNTMAGTKMEDTKLSVRLRNENSAVRLAKEPFVKKRKKIVLVEKLTKINEL